MRTYSRDQWLEADGAWQALVTEPWRWKPYRQAARERGMLYPPAGEPGDSWGERAPSQFAIVARELYDGNPERLMAAIRVSRSWSEVVRRLLDGRDDAWEEASLRERDAAWAKGLEPTRGEAVETVATIIRRVADSIGVDHAA